VLVHGRLATEQWDSPEGPRTSLVLEALAIGPDLTYGRASFARTVNVGAGGSTVTPSDGEDGAVPVADDDPWASDGHAGDVLESPAGVVEGSPAVGDGNEDGGSDGVEAAEASGGARQLDRV
jgi:single-strand DNA-binding protein